ncbi:lipopolysaccharide heptosyltransferase II [Massilia forsythiae]|uniref:lipopolysaccharide heptosyltransferase II n=1 Tax=Massilia forsythiae TaxID=2728020 RepID=A0A7Z2VX32_9BURK|nr:lipopolysaccharide heptosyltransferase II [Massilia forsythiae]QJE00719.1 lipopolysaccharide heptosyltransferase II [Massilia forsythiae]
MSGVPRTLVISPNWIGDAVMAQPLLRLLKQACPERPIDVLAPPQVVPVWRRIQEADTIMETPFRHGALQLRERWRFARLLRHRGYRDAYVLPNTLKYGLIPWLARIPQRIGYKGETRYGMINVMHHDTPPRSMVPFYAALAGEPALLPPQDIARPALVVGGEETERICARLGIAPGRPVVAFAPGAEFGIAKRWPPAHYGALAGQVAQMVPNVQIALLGSLNDRETCEQVRMHAGAGGAAGAAVLNLAGQTSLDEAIALLARMDAVVSNDSGLLHIASALNRPVVALYGSTDPDYAPPLSEMARTVSLRLACSPCRQRECPLGHHDCMNKMSVDLVWSELAPMLQLVKLALP